MASSWLIAAAALLGCRTCGSPEPHGADRAALEHAAALLAEAHAEVERADNKAQILLAAVGVAAGALAGGVFAGSWSPFSLGLAVQWLWWLGLAVGAVGTGLLAGAVYPRPLRRHGADPEALVGYFGDALHFPSDEELADAVRRSAASRLELTVNQLRQVSTIVTVKYRAVARGMWCVAAALAGCGAAMLLDRIG
ncbi:DUF5706 domain-containing protein [Streptomyces sp. B1866]|uniref:Pycsar system effector family protein n=1 Tax=Streptomyces sp. B1866 TaxID=3075431 RepID=UPI002890AA3D|nr:Pycsar system effector family protein [Streptomyces sp. B1866]MDT3396031.1 DUF5706 domain-containing protein [Streptomyces sp. B1866]